MLTFHMSCSLPVLLNTGLRLGGELAKKTKPSVELLEKAAWALLFRMHVV
jgi:hypothetical protein